MKLGLVLAGGGGKGAYQIGVWKYLTEIGLSEKISVISGTSVGGLNAVLLSLCDFKTAEKIWTSELENCILDTKNKKNKTNALFSREGLLKIIEKYINLENIKASKRKIFITCFNTKINKIGAEYYCLNNRPVEDIKQLLCATSAIPFIFQKEKIYDKKLIDGGIKENVPTAPLYQLEKCTDALIINLNDKYTDYSGFPINIIDIHPSSDLGNLIDGTLNFSAEKITKIIEIGYNDCKTIYKTQLDTILGDKMINEELRKEMDKINNMNDECVLKETLLHLTINPREIGLLQCNKNILPEKTKGGKVFWRNIAEYNGWKVQEHILLHFVRFLDQLDNCKCWSNDKEKMIGICRQFLVQKLNKT